MCSSDLRCTAVHEHQIAAQSYDGRLDDIDAILRARDPHAQSRSACLGRELWKEDANDRDENVYERDQRDRSWHASHDPSRRRTQYAALSRETGR